jgi:hypothetical protein
MDETEEHVIVEGPPPPEQLHEQPIERAPGRLSRAARAARDAVKGAFVAAEILPVTNEGLRYGALAATEVATRDPLMGAAVLGGSTLLIEGAGAIAASDLITRPTANKMLSWVNDKIEKIVSADTKMSKPMEAAVALYAGAPSLMILQQRQEPERTREEALKQGLIATAWVSGVCAVEGAAISEGLGNYTDPKKLAAAVAAVGVFQALPAWVKRRLDKRKEAKEVTEPAQARYNLSPEELTTLEKELVGTVKEKHPEEGIVSVWISPKSKFANFVRCHEAGYFPEVEEVSAEDEKNTLFMALVDTRSDSNRVVHAATITGVNYKDNDGEPIIGDHELGDAETGFFTVDSLIEKGNFTSRQFYDYYAAEGLDLKKCLSVETNFRIGEKVENFHGFRTADIAYLMFFKMLERTHPTPGKSVIFATINKASIDSFRRIGLVCKPLMGREDMSTPESEAGRESLPVAIPYDAASQKLFNSINAPIAELFL